jgi:TonB family protein
MFRNRVVAALMASAFLVLAGVPAQADSSSLPPMISALPGQPCGLRAIRETHMIAPYPDLSRKLNEQGSVTVLVTISPQGVPTDATVQTSSGYDRLDASAVDWIKQTWRWQPLDASCPAGARTLVRNIFEIKTLDDDVPFPQFTLHATAEDLPPGAWTPGNDGMVFVRVLPDGGALVVRASDPTLGGLAVMLVRKHKFEPARMDGVPLSSLVVLVQFGTGQASASQRTNAPSPVP